MLTHKVITMPNFDKIDYVLMFVIAVLAYCCYVCYNKKPEGYAPLAYFSVADPKYQVESQNVMSAPIVYNAPDPGAGQSVRPIPVSAGPVSPVQEGYMQPPPQDIKTIVPAHLSGGFVNPLSNPQMGFLPGGMEYGVSVPAMGNLSASVTSDNTPGALNVWSTVI